jgi:hypothetical protein
VRLNVVANGRSQERRMPPLDPSRPLMKFCEDPRLRAESSESAITLEKSAQQMAENYVQIISCLYRKKGAC